MINFKKYKLKYFVFGIFVQIFISCASNMSQNAIHEMSYEKVINLNISKDDLYKFSLNWVKINLTGINKLVYKNHPQDLNTGIKNSFIVNTIISSGYFNLSESSNFKIKYTCKIDCKENQAKIKFFDYSYENLLESDGKFSLDKKTRRKLIKNFESLIQNYRINAKSLSNI